MDAVGNITVKSQEGSSPITMTYNAGSRLVTSVEGAVVSTYTFDANGNQTAVNAGGSRTTYAYDYENRMRTAIDPGGARSTMAYWADGMRRFLEVGGTRTTFVWNGSDYLQSRTPSEVTTFSTVDAQILDSETGGSESLLVPDSLGSVVKVLDASGNQVYDAAYWPNGEIRDSNGVNDTPWGYAGTWGYHSDTSRRLYIRARVFDPITAKWYTVDRWWIYTSNYVYVNGRPIYKIDPSGLIGQGLGGAGAGCIIGGLAAAGFSFMRGESPEQAACKAGVSCVGGAIFGLISAEWPVAAKCLGGAIAGAVTSAGASLCTRQPCDPPVNVPCVVTGALISAILGCTVQGLGDELQQLLLKLTNQAVQGSAGSICTDITRGRPGQFPPMVK
jgi:RHS repeat-associated protein